MWSLQTHNKSSSGVLERAADMSDDVETEVNYYVCYHGKASKGSFAIYFRLEKGLHKILPPKQS